MAALTTLFTPSSWCSDRFVVFVDDHAPGTSIIPPTSGWIDPSFTKCIPTQYTTAYPTFSPGVCPVHMGIVDFEAEVSTGKTIYTATCCQSGFSLASIDPGYLCTSSITTPMTFLLDPDISTADVYTTLPPELWIGHDQVVVQWEPADLSLFPAAVSSQYVRLMGITKPPSTEEVATEKTQVPELTLRSTKTSVTSIIWSMPIQKSPTTTVSETQPLAPKSNSEVAPTKKTTLQGLGGSTALISVLAGMALAWMAI